MTSHSVNTANAVPLDRVAEKLAALGVPAIVLIVTISLSGLAGGAAIVAALAALGGPFGMLGGLTLLGVLVLISNALAQWGIDKLLGCVLAHMKKQGRGKYEIIQTIDSYWFLSSSRKQAIRQHVKSLYPM